MALSVAYRQYRQDADDIKETSPSKVKQERHKKFVKENAEPRLFELVMGPRAFKNGQILPYDLEIPDKNLAT